MRWEYSEGCGQFFIMVVQERENPTRLWTCGPESGGGMGICP